MGPIAKNWVRSVEIERGEADYFVVRLMGQWAMEPLRTQRRRLQQHIAVGTASLAEGKGDKMPLTRPLQIRKPHLLDQNDRKNKTIGQCPF